MKTRRNKADLKLKMEDNVVLFEPITAKGRRWIQEERGLDCDNETVYAAYWKGTDKWSRERSDEFPNAISEMLKHGLVLDWSDVPQAVQMVAYGSPMFLLYSRLGLIV